MLIRIAVEFKVEEIDPPNEDPEADFFDEDTAKAAASLAAHHFLSLVKAPGHVKSVDSVIVRVDGFGPCRVSLGEDHEPFLEGTKHAAEPRFPDAFPHPRCKRPNCPEQVSYELCMACARHRADDTDDDE